jgi:hypothetical protein
MKRRLRTRKCLPLPAAKTRKVDYFRLLGLPTDILLYCLSFAVSVYTDVLSLSKVCLTLQQVLCTNICDFRHIPVHLQESNVSALTAVYPFWDNFIIDGSLPAAALRVFQHSLRSIFLISTRRGILKELEQAPKLRELTINAAGHCNIDLLCSALPLLSQLETLCIRYGICRCLAPALPRNLRHLSARRISVAGAQHLPVLDRLTRLRLNAFCDDPHILTAKLPALRKYYIQQFRNQHSDLLDFAPFRHLRDLQFGLHGRFTVPASLTRLDTLQSNQLVGPLPTCLQELTLVQRAGLPLLTEQLDRLCSLPMLSHLSVTDVQPSTLQKLSLLRELQSLHLKYRERLNLLQFPLPLLRSLTLTECNDSVLYFQLTAIESLVDLTIIDSTVSQTVVHLLLRALPALTELSLWGCCNVEPDSLRVCYPAVMIDYMC